MRKRLLFAFMAMCVSVAGFALENGEFIYTPQGRFLITGPNENANSSFQDFTGWTVATAAGKTLEDIFVINGNGYAEGINSVQSTDATAGEGMYYTYEPTDASGVYVVSYKMKASAVTSVRVKTVAVSTNLVKVEGNSDNTWGGATDVLVANTAEELTTEWQTYTCAIMGDGTARTWYISFTGMATDIEIADVQIAPAVQYADLRLRDAMLAKMKAYKDCYAWDESILEDYAMTETITNLEAITDETGVDELNEQLTTAKEVLAEFLSKNMDDFLAGRTDRDSYFDTWRTKLQKQSKIGEWTILPGGRGFWESNSQQCPDLGHYQNGAVWNNGAAADPMGVYSQKELEPGSYVFSIEGAAALREPKSKDWNNDDGLKPAYGVAYVVKIVDGVATDTLAIAEKELEAVNMTNFMITAKVEEDGIYEFGFKAYCKESHQAFKCGSVTYVKNASIWAKTNNKYRKVQLNYEADVREQITTGRTQLTTAAENLANAANYWGKAELQACVDTVAPKIERYEALSQDAIIATFDEGAYVKANRTSNADEGLLVYEVYSQAVKDIIAANKKFTAVNDTLNSMQNVIDAANATLALRIYSAATGKDDLTAAISANEKIQAEMKQGAYSEENAAAIVAANATLTQAIEDFKNSVPASAFTSIVDIDFENDAVLNEETQLYSITGANGSMVFSNFSAETKAVDAIAYQQGLWDNSVQLYKGYVRVGNGTGTVEFDPSENGSMGSNILKINCDFFLQGLSGKFVGFFVEDQNDSILVSYYANYYDNKIDATSNLPVELGSLQYVSGSGYANKAPEGALDIDGNVVTGTTLPKNSFEVIMDFGEGTIYCTTTSAKGTVTTAKQAFDKTVPAKFILKSDYINNDRRIWFDNLKIQRIVAGEVIIIKGDANGDGAVDVADVVAIVNKILGEPAANFVEAAADVNGDGTIDVADVVATVNIILGE